MTLSRWKKLMASFGFAENRAAYNSILEHHSESHRAYHNVEHISDCLSKLDLFGEELEDRNVIELAIWFHDIIYNPYGKNNELKSARAAVEFLKNAGAEEAISDQVSNLILATQHKAKATSAPVPLEASAEAQAEKTIMDVDLSILGSPPDIYDEYTNNIRKEYKLIPKPIFRKKRKEILTEFLKREPLFHTLLFRNKFEKQAKENIKRELGKYL